MVQKINERLFAKIHLSILLKENRQDELIEIVNFYFSQKPSVVKKLSDRYEAEIKIKKPTKGKKQNEKAKENDNVVSIATDDNTD